MCLCRPPHRCWTGLDVEPKWTIHGECDGDECSNCWLAPLATVAVAAVHARRERSAASRHRGRAGDCLPDTRAPRGRATLGPRTLSGAGHGCGFGIEIRRRCAADALSVG